MIELDLIDTIEECEKRLSTIENKIAIDLDLDLSKNIRDQIINLDARNQLVENELVAEWQECLVWYTELKED